VSASLFGDAGFVVCIKPISMLITLDMKHKYGYMEVPGVGFIAVPPDLFNPRDRNLIKLFNEAVTREYSLSHHEADPDKQWPSAFKSRLMPRKVCTGTISCLRFENLDHQNHGSIRPFSSLGSSSVSSPSSYLIVWSGLVLKQRWRELEGCTLY
jgi:hypothetical protein